MLIEDIISSVNDSYIEARDMWSDLAAGELRQARGEWVEEIVTEIWSKLAKHNGLRNTSVLREIKITRTTPSGKKVSIMKNVDCCFTIDDVPVIAIECKSYLESCYLDRAASDMRWIAVMYPEIKKVIFSLENALGNNDAYEFYTCDGEIDETFFLLDGKRSSRRPIYDPDHYKDINEDKLRNFIEYLDQLQKRYNGRTSKCNSSRRLSKRTSKNNKRVH